MVTVEQVRLLPLFHRETIPESYLDLMGHMNIRWYMAVFDEAAWNYFASCGMDAAYFQSFEAGGFALKHHIHYLAEVHVGETVAVHTRTLGRSAKRIHFMHFMVNETTHKLAATMEVLGAHADMRIRRITPYPPQLAAAIDAILLEQNQLMWDAPICGVIEP